MLVNISGDHGMDNRLEIIKVNKHEAGWDASVLYTGFQVRAILKEHTDAITKVNARYQLTRRLRREMGEEGEGWVIMANSRTGEDELYLQNSGKLIMWKLQNTEKFNELFGRVEQHKDNLDEIREDE